LSSGPRGGVADREAKAIKADSAYCYKLILSSKIDGTFSSNKHVPIFKLENHVKELELFREIQKYVNSGNLIITPPRKNRLVSNPTVVLEINKIHG
jgi:hypothetical protein